MILLALVATRGLPAEGLGSKGSNLVGSGCGPVSGPIEPTVDGEMRAGQSRLVDGVDGIHLNEGGDGQDDSNSEEDRSSVHREAEGMPVSHKLNGVQFPRIFQHAKRRYICFGIPMVSKRYKILFQEFIIVIFTVRVDEVQLIPGTSGCS